MNAPEQLQNWPRQLFARFQRLPQRSKRAAISITVGLLLVLIVGAWVIRSFVYHRTPEYALQLIDSINSPEDIKRCEKYLTPQGQRVITYLVNHQNGPPSSAPLHFQARQIRGTTCYFPFNTEGNEGYVQLRQNDVWQFDDIVFTRYKGREIEVSVAYTIDHPILASLKMLDWNEMLNNFIKGFLIGWKLAGG